MLCIMSVCVCDARLLRINSGRLPNVFSPAARPGILWLGCDKNVIVLCPGGCYVEGDVKK